MHVLQSHRFCEGSDVEWQSMPGVLQATIMIYGMLDDWGIHGISYKVYVQSNHGEYNASIHGKQTILVTAY